MCYLTAQTFDFRDSSLWMLTGRNGAGKSTVFDAMRWALFGVHRGGAQGNNALIHHDASAMKVVFSFGLGADTVRITRTQTRGGKSSRQIERDRGRGYEAVAGSELEVNFREWMSANLGLSDATFCSAMYLGQNRAEELLNANPRARYDVLSEIVDLSAFQRLHAAADARRRTARDAVQGARALLDAAPSIEDGTLENGKLSVAQTRAARDESARRVAALEELRPGATQWEKWRADRADLETERGQLESLVADADAIERDLARLSWLQNALPPLLKWRQTAARRARLENEIGARESALATLDATLESAQSRQQTAGARALKLRVELEVATADFNAALQHGALTAAPRAQIENLERSRAAARKVAAQLADLPAEVEAQMRELSEQIGELEALQGALPHLKIFASAREKWRAARAEIARLKACQSEASAEVERARDELERAQSAEGAAENALQSARENATRAETELENARGARQRFEEVAGEAECHFCGQTLTPQHAARERERLELALESAGENAEHAQNVRRAALQEFDARGMDAQTARKQSGAAERAGELSARALESARREQSDAALDANGALGEIGPPWRARFDDNAIQGEFPRAAHIEEWNAQLGDLAGAKKQRDLLQNQLAQRALWLERQTEIESELAPLQAEFPDERIAEIRAQAANAEHEQREANARIEAARAPLRDAENQSNKAREQVETLQAQRAPLEQSLASKRGEAGGVRNQLDEQRAELSDELKKLADAGADLDGWQDELARLGNGDLRARADALQSARAQIGEVNNQSRWLDKQIESLPIGARRALAEIDAELRAARAARENAEGELEKSARELANGEAARARRLDLEKEWSARETDWRRLETLTELLGPQKLQLFLLQEAQVGIIGHANAILNRISSGSLRLELRREDLNVQGRARGPSALDFVVFHQPETGIGSGDLGLDVPPQAIEPTFLSGSQRFRVAVALALGIGRFAASGQSAGRLESVIIDEGFGSLDRVGRDEMLGELRNLGRELQRVILVSHQEDFAQGFPNRYLIEHDGRQARARLESG